MRQGPFLFQPAPRELEQGEGGDATDLMYMSVEGASLHADVDGNEARLGVLVMAYSDGKVDVCLDVEKIEAMWEVNRVSNPSLHIHLWADNSADSLQFWNHHPPSYRWWLFTKQ